VTARSHSFIYEDRLLILAAVSSTKIQGRNSICNIFCIICTYIQYFLPILTKYSFLIFNNKSLSNGISLPNIRLKQGGMSPQKQITVPK
jgi:hypothetical protein